MIVPNKMADFLWHSHMQDNEGYKKDMTTMLKRVLNHIDDFSQADLQNIRSIQKKLGLFCCLLLFKKLILLQSYKTIMLDTDSFSMGKEFVGEF